MENVPNSVDGCYVLVTFIWHGLIIFFLDEAWFARLVGLWMPRILDSGGQSQWGPHYFTSPREDRSLVHHVMEVPCRPHLLHMHRQSWGLSRLDRNEALYFQQNSAPPHNTHSTVEFLQWKIDFSGNVAFSKPQFDITRFFSLVLPQYVCLLDFSHWYWRSEGTYRIWNRIHRCCHAETRF